MNDKLEDGPIINKVVTEGDTYDVFCSCNDCDWELFPSAWLRPDELEAETPFLTSLYQDHHNFSGACRSEIIVDFKLAKSED